jgi:hypothetical protein
MRKLPLVGSQKRALTDVDLFREVFLPHYPPGASLDVVRTTDANPAKNPAIYAALEETADVFATLAEDALGVSLGLDGSDASIHRLSAALTPEARDALYERRVPTSDGASTERLLLLFVVHASIYVARAIVRNHGGEWLVRSPLWETRVALTSPAGQAELCPFSWILRALADPTPGAKRETVSTLADRYHALVEIPRLDASTWPVLAPPDRKLPRLGRVRYDTLYQHLSAHLPELGDFGEDFPSPQRFAELELKSLTFRLVGGGRALVLMGPGKGGIHLFWMSNRGFLKALFVEGDAVPEPTLQSFEATAPTGPVESLRLVFWKSGEPRELETLWWGP